VQVQEAKAQLSVLIKAAESGQPTLVTKRGKPVAMLVPMSEARKLHRQRRTTQKNFADFLLTYPGGIELERNEAPSREVEF